MCESKQNSVNKIAYKRITLNVFPEVIYLYSSISHPSTYLSILHQEKLLYIYLKIIFLATPCFKQDLFPNRGMDLFPLQWKQGELAPGTLGKSQKSL